MTDMPPVERLAKLRAVETWLEWQLGQTRKRIHDLEQETQPVGYVIEPKQHPKHPQPALIHLADCTMPERKTSPVDAHSARLGLTKDADNLAARPFCTPDKTLGLNE